MADIRITAEPTDHTRCRFVLPMPLLEGGARRFTSPAEAEDSPLVAGIFAISGLGVSEVIVSGSTVTVVKTTGSTWQQVGKSVGDAIRTALTAGTTPVSSRRDERKDAVVDDDALYDRVADLFETQVNPMVARHGGRIELIDVQDAIVLLRMSGGCQGCGMADVTLRQGIEAMLRQEVPEVQGITDITDHASGTSPYVSASKK
ncbi:MAG TPA: NifU family protein [Gemmatimonadales bacterium]|nr:NifU family protein [Gemmatimonadales bacterium]